MIRTNLAKHLPQRSLLSAIVTILLCCGLLYSVSYANLISPGPLTKSHRGLEGATNCGMCHQIAGEKAIAVANCLQCHTNIKKTIDQKSGYHGRLTQKCESCHKEHIGVNGRLIRWDPKAFNHDETGYKLDGAHEKLQCNQCHKNAEKTYLGLDTKCLSCHKDQHGSDLKRTCTECHSNLGWKQPPPTFDHSKTKWALTGKHKEVACLSCHKENKWSSLKTDCKSCHNDPHQGKFSQNCTECHTSGGWKNIAGFDHSKTGFPLVGAHLTQRCDACHNPRLKPVLAEKTCFACHGDKHNGQLSRECKTCHNETSFKPALYTLEQHNQTPFPLAGKHIEQGCNECHKENKFKFTSDDKKCSGCHADKHNGQLSKQCENCHTVNGFKPSTFTVEQHKKTKFELVGKHLSTDCAKCHKDGKYVFTEPQRECLSCHQDQHKGQLASTCQSCHSPQAWKPSSFTVQRHNMTAFALTGKHVTTACTECHKDGKYRIAGATESCTACHKDQHNGQFGRNCTDCHNTSAWKGAGSLSFDHRKTRFPLDGQHRSVTCTQCHTNGVFQGTPMECSRCHTEPHEGLLGNQCNDCHRTSRWNDLSFRHNQTNFPLTNKHATVACNECHKTQRYVDVTNDCYSCHTRDYTQAAQPVHSANAFPPNQCINCHRSGGPNWKPASFRHNEVFTLNNQHAVTQCTECHVNGRYAGTPRDCYGCHQSNYSQASNPTHTAAGFPTAECASCHRDGGPDWRPATFAAHNTVFPLNNRHGQIVCASCHTNGQYTGTPRECQNCHQSDYQGATNPVHSASVFPQTECRDCHSDGGPNWQPANFNHDRVYVLQNRHRTPPRECNECHINNQYSNTPTTCWGCHENDFNEAVQEEPEHRNYSHDCIPCHLPSDNDWDDGGNRFNNHATFPLNGTHASPSPTRCDQCHTTGQYTGTPRECIGCHQTAYQQTLNPVHVEEFFPSANCNTCHTSGGTDWHQVVYTHTTTFPLVNDHQSPAPTACNECHTNTQYASTPTDCYSCHQTQYQGATNPPHTTSGFPPSACATCHANGGPNWSPATFPHTVFPLVNDHQSPTPTACNECHTNGQYAGTPSDCYSCHQTQYQNATNPAHTAAGFPSSACASCHTSGGPDWRPSTFAHTTFPLLNDHQSPTPTTCNQCHSNGQYAGTPSDCFSCHQTQYQSATNPVHTAQFFPSANCGTCHSNGGPAWQPAAFTHSAYTLMNDHQSPNPTACNRCHTNGQYTGTPTNCYSCHQTQYQGATNPVHTAQFFPLANCGTCHSNGGPAWQPGVFTHTTTFALTGNHLSPNPTDCNECHPNGQYTGTASDCYSCHQTDYTGATNPAHTAATHPVSACNTCHTSGGPNWNSSFNHATAFALQGRHTQATCTECHLNNQYSGTPRDCYQCHIRSNPNIYPADHQASSNIMTTNCVTCHYATDNAWTQGRLSNHTWFPITSGRHRNITCANCHTTSTTYILFNCITCHGGCNSINGDHNGVSGYQCLDARCYQCHPDGSEGPNLRNRIREGGLEQRGH
ncbi:MAG: multiheme c-type cytochrome [bacterium]|nr:multiheme c-type cytochrome [bacterium]